MDFSYSFKGKISNLRSLESFLKEIYSLTGADSLSSKSNFSLTYDKKSIGINLATDPIKNLYKEWDKNKKEALDFFYFYMYFQRKIADRVEDLNFSVFINYVGVWAEKGETHLSIQGLSKKNAQIIKSKFKRLFGKDIMPIHKKVAHYNGIKSSTKQEWYKTWWGILILGVAASLIAGIALLYFG